MTAPRSESLFPSSVAVTLSGFSGFVEWGNTCASYMCDGWLPGGGDWPYWLSSSEYVPDGFPNWPVHENRSFKIPATWNGTFTLRNKRIIHEFWDPDWILSYVSYDNMPFDPHQASAGWPDYDANNSAIERIEELHLDEPAIVLRGNWTGGAGEYGWGILVGSPPAPHALASPDPDAYAYPARLKSWPVFGLAAAGRVMFEPPYDVGEVPPIITSGYTFPSSLPIWGYSAWGWQQPCGGSPCMECKCGLDEHAFGCLHQLLGTCVMGAASVPDGRGLDGSPGSSPTDTIVVGTVTI